MPGKFVVQKNKKGEFHFNLVSTNGQIVATSQRYATKQACMRGVASVRKLAADAALHDLSAPETRPAPARKKA